MAWKDVPIRKELADRIQRIFKTLGYNSIAAFVADAVRRFLPEAENRFEEVQENVRSWEAEKKEMSD